MTALRGLVVTLAAVLALGVGLVGAGTATAAPAPQVITLHPGGNPGQRVDAVVDHAAALSPCCSASCSSRPADGGVGEPAHGASGSTGLPDRVAPANRSTTPTAAPSCAPDPVPSDSSSTGRSPADGLIPTLSYILPIPHLVTV